jgi:arylsulfatase A-like enzyme
LLLTSGWLLALTVAGTALFLNGYPVLIYDTERYSPSHDITSMASSLPHFLNLPPFLLFGAYGAALTGMLASAYGLTRLVLAIANRLQLSSREALALLATLSLLSFFPLYAIMISSEPYAIAFLAVGLATAIDRQLSWLDLAVAGATAVTHLTSVPLIALVLILAFVLGFRPRVAHVALLAAATGASLFIDRVLYQTYGPGEEPLSTAYVGAQILSIYPFVLDARCASDPDFRLCRDPYRSHIDAQTLQTRKNIGPKSLCGQNSGADYLWGPTTLLSAWGTSTLPVEAQLSHAEFNALSRELVGTFITELPAHFLQVLGMSFCRLEFGLASRGWRPLPPEWIPLAGESWVRRAGFLPSPDDVAVYERSCFGSGVCQGERASTIYYTIIIASYILLVPSLWLTGRRRLDTQWFRLVLLLVGTYLLSAFIMFNISNFSPRYAYRLFFLITAVDALGIAVLMRAWRKVPNMKGAQSESAEHDFSSNKSSRLSTIHSGSNVHIGRIIGSTVALWLVLLAARSKLLEVEFGAPGTWPAAAASAMSAGVHDFVLVFAIGLVASVVAGVLRSRILALRTVYASYLILASLVAIAGVANIEIVKTIGMPLTYEWLYYADFLRSVDTRFYVLNSLTALNISLLCLAVGSVFLLGYFLGSGINLIPVRWRAWPAAALSLVAVVSYLAFARSHVIAQGWPSSKIANPVVVFAASALGGTTPLLFTMSTKMSADDVRIVGERPSVSTTLPGTSRDIVRNVILFVMESVPAEHVETYGGKFPVTPNIAALRSASIQFQNIYAPAPATNFALVSLLTSIYPAISHKSMTQEHPDIALPSLSGELDENGFRTGFFSSADTRFQSLDRFLARRNFDIIQDYRGRSCDMPTFANSGGGWQHMDLSSDPCTAQSAIDWIDSKRDQPFFAVIFTGLTHYPYFTLGDEVRYTQDDNFNRYLNGLRATDGALGDIVRYLERTGQADSTLVIVVGDHGEAFGRHPGNFVHAGAIYEENVHVPLLMWNKALFDRGTSHEVGNLIDIAPTVLDILGVPPPATWQGRSLFSTDRPNRTYFFCPWYGFRFGYREANNKFIFDANSGTAELYDLSTDPQEMVNLATSKPEFVAESIEKLAGWVQYQNRLIARMTAVSFENKNAITVRKRPFREAPRAASAR